MLENWPVVHKVKYLNYFYMIKLGHHFHNFLEHTIMKLAESDWIEMTLHHILTIGVMFYSYYFNMYDVGVPVLLIHDIGDLFMNFGKFIRNMKILVYF
jgi:TLC domain